MKSSDYAMILLLLSLFIVRPAQASESNIPHLQWGQSMQDVMAGLSIQNFIEDESKSLFSGMPVRSMLVRKNFLGYACNLVFSFSNNKLVEYYFEIDAGDNSQSDVVFKKIRNFLTKHYKTYAGEYFHTIKDRFVDEAMNTCVLATRDKKIMVYILDFNIVINTLNKITMKDTDDLNLMLVK